MNSHGQPTGPEFAMLDELHTLWGRVFGQATEPTEPEPQRRPLAVAAVVLAALAVVVFRVWVF